MILERAGETEAALELLSKHQGSLDAYVPSACLGPIGVLGTPSWDTMADTCAG